jgi:hypothetical protein
VAEAVCAQSAGAIEAIAAKNSKMLPVAEKKALKLIGITIETLSVFNNLI